MSQFYLNPVHQAAYNTRAAFAAPAHPHHAARSRRSARYNGSQSSSKSTKVPRISKDNVEVNQASTARTAYEAARSFDLEDDEVFCPWHLLTEDDVSISNRAQPIDNLDTNAITASINELFLLRSVFILLWLTRDVTHATTAPTQPYLLSWSFGTQHDAGIVPARYRWPSQGPPAPSSASQGHSHHRPYLSQHEPTYFHLSC